MFSRISKIRPPTAPDRRTRNKVNIFSTPNGVPFGGDLQVGTSSSNLKRFNGMKIVTSIQVMLNESDA